jgi:hypothetical protein
VGDAEGHDHYAGALASFTYATLEKLFSDIHRSRESLDPHEILIELESLFHEIGSTFRPASARKSKADAKRSIVGGLAMQVIKLDLSDRSQIWSAFAGIPVRAIGASQVHATPQDFNDSANVRLCPDRDSATIVEARSSVRIDCENSKFLVILTDGFRNMYLYPSRKAASKGRKAEQGEPFDEELIWKALNQLLLPSGKAAMRSLAEFAAEAVLDVTKEHRKGKWVRGDEEDDRLVFILDVCGDKRGVEQSAVRGIAGLIPTEAVTLPNSNGRRRVKRKRKSVSAQGGV